MFAFTPFGIVDQEEMLLEKVVRLVGRAVFLRLGMEVELFFF
jgi:hypothetical protein